MIPRFDNTLGSEAHNLLALLVSILPKVVPNDPRTYISYREVHRKLGLSQVRNTFGESLKAQGLLELAEWTAKTGKPGITGIIISTETMMPGKGYFTLFSKEPDDFIWWEKEVRQSKEFHWSLAFSAPISPPTPSAYDLGEPNERSEQTIYRVLRDTVLARQVKKLHDYECQICGSTLTLPDGTRYAEAHHIRPLGRPHNGPDLLQNIVCVCPNHHAELDYGVRAIDISLLKFVMGHELDLAFVRYHNTSIFQRNKQPI